MPQDLIQLQLTDAKLLALDKGMTALEAACSDLIALDPPTRRRLTKMGAKSEKFCRQTLTAMANNPQIVPPSLGLSGAQGDLASLDHLRARRQRLERLLERFADTETLLGSDVITTALEGYGLLKVAGKSQGLTGLRQGLSERFKGQGRRPGNNTPEETEEAA